ncbi:hypothetical protein [Arthrobacter sp. ISL-72]|uniref:hypothetical protein n=1 Tax=Arthrobacter sp. ISL-72 TaxID=2819114 RepID=UPI001BEA8A11|nr:hypothetical protein [Arthrobacter sp. ISL-72]MBT2594718.1 hypothetical protein [Arthrobacter sp. ISL-72]
METFGFARMIKFYAKQVAQAERMHGEDWRSAMYRERLQRVTDLSAKAGLSKDEIQYLTARQAVASVF